MGRAAKLLGHLGEYISREWKTHITPGASWVDIAITIMTATKDITSRKGEFNEILEDSKMLDWLERILKGKGSIVVKKCLFGGYKIKRKRWTKMKFETVKKALQYHKSVNEEILNQKEEKK